MRGFVDTFVRSGWFAVAAFYLLPAFALVRFPRQRGPLLRAIVKAALYGWCIVAVLTLGASRFQRHPFTWRESLLGATMYLVFASPLMGLIMWAGNGSTRAGFRTHGKSLYYDPELDRSHAKADERMHRDHRGGA